MILFLRLSSCWYLQVQCLLMAQVELTVIFMTMDMNKVSSHVLGGRDRVPLFLVELTSATV